jgi:hypothetical protein
MNKIATAIESSRPGSTSRVFRVVADDGNSGPAIELF